MRFFDISSSKSAPTLVCFVHDLEMCFVAPSQLPKVVRTRCLMSFLTWKCASRHNGVHFFDIATSRTAPKLKCFIHFDLEMCFATSACNFSFLLWPDGSASRCFSEVTFQPSGATNHRKNTVNRDFPIIFSRACIVFFLTLSPL